MSDHQVLVIGLDGFDIGYGSQLMDDGELPALSALRDRSARYLLEHGPAARTGLAWEHFASAMGPETAQRASMLELDRSEYEVLQRGTRFAPFFRSFEARIVIFDPPYTDMDLAPGTRGVVSWSAHDPGVNPTSKPVELLGELDTQFGTSASKAWTYVSPWPSEPRTADMARGLVDGLRTRREAACWLFAERCPDWDLAIVVAGEPHSAAEAFWHGVDADHPLHDLPSAATAGQGLRDVYRETDRLVAELIDATAPQTVVVFSMGGMGPNNSDVASMVLLPELMYRWATAKEMLSLPREWTDDPTGVPLIPECQDWVQAMAGCYPSAREPKTRGLARRVARKLPANVRRRVVRALRGADFRVATYSVEWLPATRYRAEWPTMRAFALPSFYDGRVRVNVRGREPSGLVEPADYAATCDEIEALLTACRDPRTGEPVVARIERPGGTDPLALGSSYADLVIEWGSGACAFAHPNFGVIGPAPYRRTGGHTGPFGFAYLSGADIEPGDHGIRSAFDVSPTVATLLDTSMPPSFDGTSLLVEPV